MEFPPDATTERKTPRAASRDPIDWHDLATKEPPARRWAIKGWLGYGHVTLLVGQGGIGKTLIAQQAASCLALGRSFIDDVDAQARILMWACEDDHDELWRRQISISRWLKIGLEEFAENLVIIPRHGLDNALVATEFGKLMFTPTIALLEEQAKDLKAEVVVLDNVAQLYGGSENDRHSVTAFLNALSGALPGTAILLLAHPSRGTGSEFSGSSAWENVARTRLYLGSNLPDQKPDEEPSQDVRYLSRRKSNYSNKDFRRCTYRDQVLVPDEQEQAGGVINSIRAGKAERVVMDGLRILAEKDIYPTDGPTSPRFLPRVLNEYKLTDGLTRPELADAMRRLIMEGRIKRSEVRRGSDRKPIYGLALSP